MIEKEEEKQVSIMTKKIEKERNYSNKKIMEEEKKEKVHQEEKKEIGRKGKELLMNFSEYGFVFSFMDE